MAQREPGGFIVVDEHPRAFFMVDNEVITVYAPIIGCVGVTVYNQLKCFGQQKLGRQKQPQSAKALGISLAKWKRGLHALTTCSPPLVRVDRYTGDKRLVVYVLLPVTKALKSSSPVSQSLAHGRARVSLTGEPVSLLSLKNLSFKEGTHPPDGGNSKNGDGRVSEWQQYLGTLEEALDKCLKAGKKPPDKWEMEFNAAPDEIRRRANTLIYEANQKWEQQQRSKPQ